ncbi:MAG: isoprenylcysteine carboxylmethyltransferase family protein [Planctomycetes bacterium]|nr:isoprenylcysteine carboxylmethyltransferase family protein [Planctomycetota bacterium]
MRCFRVARTAPTWRHVAVTLLQTAVFWTTFLVLLPIAVLAVERQIGLPPLGLPHHRALGATLFTAASVLGLSTGICMAVRGRGTPLPLATARDLVVSGPYRLVRNPMAIAGIAQGVAVGLWCDSGLVALYALAGAVLWHIVVRPPEERDLQARFGAPFAAYRQNTPLWLPRLGGRGTDRVLLAALAAGAVALPTTAATLGTVWQRTPFAAALALLALHLATSSRANATSSGQNAAKSPSSAP